MGDGRFRHLELEANPGLNRFESGAFHIVIASYLLL
jgi:hypothetical protein